MSSSLTKGLAAARSTGNSFNPVNQQDGKDSMSSFNQLPHNDSQTGLISVQGSQMIMANSSIPDSIIGQMQVTQGTP